MESFIGYSLDENIRYKATSGGVGTSLMKFLLDSGKIDYVVSFKYNADEISYEPILISKFDDYFICGSIYQEINYIAKIKQLLSLTSKKGKIALFCLPCQTKALRTICRKMGFNPILIGLTCSSQQSYEATQYLFKRLGILESNVSYIQYRGNGWPSGIQIKTKDGKDYFVSNNNSIWTGIFHSRLFVNKRCFGCNNTLNIYSDIVLADPWLEKYINEETLGKTLFASYTTIGKQIIKDCLQNGYINADRVNNDEFELSQIGTIKRKKSYLKHPKIIKILSKLFLSPRYKRYAKVSLFFSIHCKLKSLIEKSLRNL